MALLSDPQTASHLATGDTVSHHLKEDVVHNSKEQFRIELTPEQKAQVRTATGKDAEAVELSVEELEERIAPGTKFSPKPA
jgi:hypothetical protein